MKPDPRMEGTEPKRVQQRVWHLVFYTSDGIWVPSFDHPQPWRTKSAARKALRKLKDRGEMYKIVCYEVKR